MTNACRVVCALLLVCGVSLTAQAQTVTLIDGAHPEPPTCYAGAVRIRLLPPEKVNMTARPGEALLVFEVTPEPRLQGFGVLASPSITRACDDQRQILLPVEDPAAGDNPGTPRVNPSRAAGQSHICPVRIKLGDKDAKHLSELTGSLPVQIQMPSEPIVTIDKVLDAENVTVKSKDNKMLLTLVSIEKQGDDGYRVKYSLEQAGADANRLKLKGNGNGNALRITIINGIIVQQALKDARKGNASLAQPVPQLVDEMGNAYQAGRASLHKSGRGKDGQTIREYSIDFHAQAGQGGPARLQISAPRMEAMLVPFSFKDVPLP